MTRKIFIFGICLVAMCSGAFSQKPFKTVNNDFSVFQNKSFGDTLMPESFNTGALILDSALAGGYVCGTNAYGDLGKAQIYVMPGNLAYNVRGVGLMIGALEVVNPTDELVVRIHNTLAAGYLNSGYDTTGAPGWVFSQASVPASMLVNNQLNIIYFSNDIYISDDYALSIDLSGFQENNIGLISSSDGDAMGVETAWEMISDGQWYSMLNAWGWDAEMGIFSIIDGASAHNRFIIDDAAVQIFPNPVQDILNLHFSEVGNIISAIQLFDMGGNRISDLYPSKAFTGSNSLSLNLSNVAPGTYFIRIFTGQGIHIKKILKI